MTVRRVRLILAALLFAAPAQARQQSAPLVPDGVDLSDGPARAIEAPWLTDDERSDLRVRHGVWNPKDLEDPVRAARAARRLADAAAFDDESVPALLRAEQLMRCGRHDDALAPVEGSRPRGRLIEAVLERMGRFEADRAVDRVLEGLDTRRTEDPDALTDAVQAMSIRARVQGRPSRDYRR